MPKLSIVKPVSDLLSIEQAAAIIGVSSRTLRRWHITGRGPAVVVISSRTKLYRREAIRAWLASNELPQGIVA